MLAAGDNAEAQVDAEFQAAIEISAAQGAKMPELRASVARARLHASRGRRQQARDILAPIYAGFSEGELELSDLAEAGALLSDLH